MAAAAMSSAPSETSKAMKSKRMDDPPRIAEPKVNTSFSMEMSTLK